MKRTDIVHKVLQVLDAQADDPAAELIRLGEALIAVGKALQGLSTSDAQEVVTHQLLELAKDAAYERVVYPWEKAR